MITVFEKTKIYVYCPAKRVTGGTELAHQLVDYLICNEKDASIVYFDNHNIVNENIPIEFKKYNVKTSTSVIDSYENIIVLPEVLFSNSKNFRQIQFIFWWMSVDNFFTKAPFLDYVFFFKPYDIFKLIYTRIINKESLFKGYSLYKLKKISNNHLHVYQSMYANYFLIKKGFRDILPLSDYINSDFHDASAAKNIKENIILYNRSKGFRFTKKIIKNLPEFKFIPLINFSKSDLVNLFSKSKIYIDFGNHPGKDRMPREAIIHDCCVVVGKNGSANYFEDIPIPNSYKIRNNNHQEIIKVIKNCINNYDVTINDFDFYKRSILQEKKIFHQEINQIFNLNNSNF